MLLLKDPAVWLKNFFIQAGFSYGLSSFLSTLALVIFIALLSWLANIIAKTVIRTIALRVVKRSKSQWDDIFYEQKVFTRLSHFAPAVVIYFTSDWALRSSVFWLSFVHYLNYIYMLAIGMVVVLTFIGAWNKIYETLPMAKDRSIKGYIQLLKIVVAIIFVLLMISIIFKKDISTIVAGLGAMAAVLILVFKDTLLSLVGSIQLYAYTSNNSWVPYEHIQSEIFEHLLAIMTEFELKVYQQPTGDDIPELSGKRNKS